MAVSTRPLSGMGSAMTTSKAEIRSEATISSRSVAGVVELPDLARLDQGQRCTGRGGVHGARSSRASVNRWTWRRRPCEVEGVVERASGVEGDLGVLLEHARGTDRPSSHAARASRCTIR